MAQDRNRQAPRAQCPEEVLAWIPWYPDGLLTERERSAVEVHAAVCRDCRIELDIVSGAPWACEGLELPDASRVFDEIRARIAAEATSRDGATVIPISRGRALSEADMMRLERWVLDPGSEQEIERARAAEIPAANGTAAEPKRAALDGTPGSRSVRRRSRSVSPAWAAAAALTLVLLGGLAGGNLEALGLRADGAEDEVADYGLASSSADATGRSASSAPMIDVVFSDAATARQIWSTLRGLGVEIVAGPTHLGVYRLRVLPDGGREGPSAARSAADAARTAEGAAASGRGDTRDGDRRAAAIAARLVDGEERIAIFAEPVP